MPLPSQFSSQTLRTPSSFLMLFFQEKIIQNLPYGKQGSLEKFIGDIFMFIWVYIISLPFCPGLEGVSLVFQDVLTGCSKFRID